MSELKRKRISQQEVLVVAIGLVIGFALKDFVEKFLVAFVTPILDKIMGGAGALRYKSVEVFGIQFKPGVFIEGTITFFVIIFVVYVMVKVFNSTGDHISQSSKKDSAKS